MIILKLNKKTILDNFLIPISRVSEECSVTFSSKNASALVSDETRSVIFYSKVNINTGLDDDQLISLNFKDVKKIIKILGCIKESDFQLKVGDNNSTISYKSPELSFKIYLVCDDVISKNTESVDKISKLKFTNTFTISSKKITEILKGDTFITNNNKIYFFTKEKQVYAEFTDKSTADVDSIEFFITDKYTGEDINIPLPFNSDHLRLVNSSKYKDITVKINNNYKILLFEINEPGIIFKYIVPGYTK